MLSCCRARGDQHGDGFSGYWAVCSFLLLPKIAMKIVTMFMRLFIRQAFVAVGTVTTSALAEVSSAGALLVSALEEALDIPPAIAGAPSPLPASARLAGQADSAAIWDLVANASSADIGPTVEAAVEQVLFAQRSEQATPSRCFVPGWLLVVVSGISSRFL